MPTENTSLNNVFPAVEFKTIDDMVIGKSNTYQRSFLIVAGSLLALLVWAAVAGKSDGQPLKSSAHEIAKDAVALADYQGDSANLALTKDIFDFGAVSQNNEGCNCVKKYNCNGHNCDNVFCTVGCN
mmetsp:Transcript_22313/g.25575  ORF Transcript_22313/g.25575 Transcript_22313/m.25575 type:complete len:127 (-) Transcript_22313:136-516(-)